MSSTRYICSLFAHFLLHHKLKSTNCVYINFDETPAYKAIFDGDLDIETLIKRKEKVSPAMHERMMEIFKEYIVVGGMPRVVQKFIDTNNFSSVLKLQRDIINDYSNNITNLS